MKDYFFIIWIWKKVELELILANKEAHENEMRFKALHNASFGGIGIHDKGIIQNFKYAPKITSIYLSHLSRNICNSQKNNMYIKLAVQNRTINIPIIENVSLFPSVRT